MAKAEPVPVLPQYVQETCPPPSYEEVMGHQIQSSIKQNVPHAELPPLSYIDVMPRCINHGDMKRKIPPVCDSFSVIVQAANQWLQSNPQYGIWKCETVERKVEANGTFDLEKMIYQESTYGFNVYVRGLRLWLFVKSNADGHPQQIGLMNVVPKLITKEISYVARGMPLSLYLHDPVLGTRYQAVRYIEMFEGLEETMSKLNQDLEKLPLQGSILNVESAIIKTCEGFFEGKTIDADSTVWAETGKNTRQYTHILRVFYVIGEPAHETISLKEFIPDMRKPPGMTSPALFCDPNHTLNRVATWIPHETGIRVVNIQSFDVRYSEFADKLRMDSNSTEDTDSRMSDRRLLHTIRVFYVTSRKVPPPTPPGFLSSRTFLPVRTGQRTYEPMSQTMYRIEAWLKLTGLPIYNVETVRYLIQEGHPQGADVTKSNYVCLRGVGLQYITAIRVYFPCPYQEPDPSYLPPAIPYKSTSGSETCVIL